MRQVGMFPNSPKTTDFEMNVITESWAKLSNVASDGSLRATFPGRGAHRATVDHITMRILVPRSSYVVMDLSILTQHMPPFGGEIDDMRTDPKSLRLRLECLAHLLKALNATVLCGRSRIRTSALRLGLSVRCLRLRTWERIVITSTRRPIGANPRKATTNSRSRSALNRVPRKLPPTRTLGQR